MPSSSPRSSPRIARGRRVVLSALCCFPPALLPQRSPTPVNVPRVSTDDLVPQSRVSTVGLVPHPGWCRRCTNVPRLYYWPCTMVRQPAGNPAVWHVMCCAARAEHTLEHDLQAESCYLARHSPRLCPLTLASSQTPVLASQLTFVVAPPLSTISREVSGSATSPSTSTFARMSPKLGARRHISISSLGARMSDAINCRQMRIELKRWPKGRAHLVSIFIPGAATTSMRLVAPA